MAKTFDPAYEFLGLCSLQNGDLLAVPGNENFAVFIDAVGKDFIVQYVPFVYAGHLFLILIMVFKPGH